MRLLSLREWVQRIGKAYGLFRIVDHSRYPPRCGMRLAALVLRVLLAKRRADFALRTGLRLSGRIEFCSYVVDWPTDCSGMTHDVRQARVSR